MVQISHLSLVFLTVQLSRILFPDDVAGPKMTAHFGVTEGHAEHRNYVSNQEEYVVVPETQHPATVMIQKLDTLYLHVIRLGLVRVTVWPNEQANSHAA